MRSDRKSGAIQRTALDAQPEPRNLRRLKKAVRDRWGQVPDRHGHRSALRTGMLGELTAVGSREALQRSVLWERLLLVAYAYGTNTGISAVAAGNYGHSEADLRYTAGATSRSTAPASPPSSSPTPRSLPATPSSGVRARRPSRRTPRTFAPTTRTCSPDGTRATAGVAC